jgi:hypothetical protein
MRLACRDFSIRAAPFLFSEVSVDYRSSTFTRPARMAALERIGHHIKDFTFKLSHSAATFLPPLLDPVTGEEVTFVYSPQIHTLHAPGFRASIPKYGTWEMTDLLTKQYPPLFHAASNVDSFIRAFSAMPHLNHLTISCDGQAPGHRYRRSVVDYALISLRIAVEQAPLKKLDSLSLLPVHPGALLYLRDMMGFGSSPKTRRRWTQIKNLKIHMDSFSCGPDQPTDHLRLLHSYIQGFTGLRDFTFCWKGAKGPCPLNLHNEPCMVDQKQTKSNLRPIKLAKLRYMEVENVILDASQVSAFIMEHRHTVTEFNYEETDLRSGTWDEALAPLTRISGSEQWKKKQEEVMDVPIVFSPVAMEMQHVRRAIWEAGKRSRETGGGSGSKYSSSYSHFTRGYGSFQRATSRTRTLLGCGPDHMKRLLRSSVFSWR